MSFLFLLRPEPYADEDGVSYLGRLAQANGYRATGGLFQAVARCEAVSIDDIADSTKLSVERLRSLSGPWPIWVAGIAPSDSPAIPPTWWNRTYIRWCPACLKSEFYRRSAWSHKLCIACPDHAVMLRETCDICGGTFSWKNSLSIRCKCGRALADMSSETADRCVIGLMDCFGSSLFRQMQELSDERPLSKLSVHERLLLLHSIGAAFAPASRRTGVTPNLQRLSAATDYIAKCASLISDWPMGFRTELDRLMGETKGTTSVRRTFHPLYRILYKNLAHEAFAFLRREFESYLAEHWRGVLDRRYRGLSEVVRSHETLSATQICNQLSISRKRLRQLTTSGVLAGYTRYSPSGRTFFASDRATVREVKSKLCDTMSLRAAGREFGLSRSRVRVLLDAAVLSSDGQSSGRNLRWKISRSEVDRLLDIPFEHFTSAGASEVVDLIPSFGTGTRTMTPL
jgi:hypothetical protein